MLGTDLERLEQLDRLISRASTEARQRLSTYVRRYMSPLLIEQLFEEGQLGTLMDEGEVSRVTVIICDIRGFTPQTVAYERRANNLRAVAELLERFFDDAVETIFAYKGVMGELSGDGFMAVFGLPLPQPDDVDRAVLASLDIYDNSVRLNRHLRLNRQHFLNFDVGMGLSTGGPIWVGDIGSDWRREWTMIGTTINLASRVEELTKEEEFSNVPGANILLSEPTVDGLSAVISKQLELVSFPARTMRGIGTTEHRIYKIGNVRPANLPALRSRIDSATLAVVDAIAQSIETVQERSDTFRLGNTMQAIGEAIASSLNLDDILESVLDGVQRFLFATTASILLVDEGSRHLRFKAVRPKTNLDKLRMVEMDLLVGGSSIVGHVASTGQSLLLSDAREDTRFFSKADNKTGFQTRSVLCTPIRLDEVVIGVVQVIDNQPGKFSKEDLRVLEAIAAFAASAIRNARQFAAISEAETMAAMGVLTSDMAHRIKNDVGMVKVVTERLLQQLDQEAEIERPYLRSKLTKIRANVDSTLRMTDEIRYPFTDLVLAAVPVRVLLEEALDAVVKRIGAVAPVEIRRHYQDLPPVHADRDRLFAVFEKVLENAFGAMRDSEKRMLTLSIDYGQSGHEMARVCITDTGPGIPPELQSRLFRLTRRPSDRRGDKSTGGWGYGLWSSSMFLRSLGGSISLDQAYANGTRILIDLPFAPADESDQQGDSETPHLIETSDG